MIKYLGSKAKLLDFIEEEIKKYPDVKVVADLFAGACHVSRRLKQSGYKVISNDLNAYSSLISKCYVEADSDNEGFVEEVKSWINYFNSLPGKDGWFTQTYCRDSRYFQPKNGMKIDKIREEIEYIQAEPLRSVLLTSLIEAADRVDSTVGLQMAYLKDWAKRSYNDLEMKMPALVGRSAHGKGLSLQMDVIEAARMVEADLVYLDPPYNQHSYLGNYHIWESLVLWDKPSVYGIAKKRIDVRERKSLFNSKRTIEKALGDLITSLKTKIIILSFSDEGYLTEEQIARLFQSLKGNLRIARKVYKRHIGSQIGIYDLAGERVGTPQHRFNTEMLFVFEKE